MSSNIKVKVILYGPAASGKSRLLKAITENEADQNFTYKTTIGVDFLVKNYIAENSPISLKLWELSGNKRFQALNEAYLKDNCITLFVINGAFEGENKATVMSQYQILKDSMAKVRSTPHIIIVSTHQGQKGYQLAQQLKQAISQEEYGGDINEYTIDCLNINLESTASIQAFNERLEGILTSEQTLQKLGIKNNNSNNIEPYNGEIENEETNTSSLFGMSCRIGSFGCGGM